MAPKVLRQSRRTRHAAYRSPEAFWALGSGPSVTPSWAASSHVPSSGERSSTRGPGVKRSAGEIRRPLLVVFDHIRIEVAPFLRDLGRKRARLLPGALAGDDLLRGRQQRLLVELAGYDV